MQTGIASVARYGAIFLPEAKIHGFLSVDDCLHRNSYVVHVDPKRFHDLWYEQSDKPRVGSPPGPFDKWDEEERTAFVQLFLKGPRRPVAIPYVTFQDGLLNVAAGRQSMQALLDWGAAQIPVAVNVRHILALHERAGLPSHDPILAREYLSATQKVLAAFEKNIPLNKLYEENQGHYASTPSLEKEVREGIQDYAALVHMQLEVMLVRYIYRRLSNYPQDIDQKERELCEVRRLLHQQGVIGSWLSHKADIEHLPQWEPSDGVSVAEALKFLDENAAKFKLRGNIFHTAQVITSQPAEEVLIEPTRREQTKPALRVVRPEDSL